MVAALARRPACSVASSGTASRDSTPRRPTTAGSDRHTSPTPSTSVRTLTGQHGVLVVGDRPHDAGRGQADGQVGVALAGDDLRRRRAHLVAQRVELVGRHPTAVGPDGVEQRRPADAGRRPQHDLAVPVLADDGGVHAVDGDAEPLGQQVAQPRRVEHRAAADHPSRRQPADLLGHERHDVDRVRHQQHHRVGRPLEQRRQQRRGRGRRWPRPGPAASRRARGWRRR